MKPSKPPTDSGSPDHRLLDELCRYYRYSAVGRRITGIVHNFNTPLQVLSFQAELMERKFQEERDKLASRLPPELQEAWEFYAGYRQQKVEQLREEVRNLNDMVRRLLDQGLHEDQQNSQSIDLNDLLQCELGLYQADRFFKHRVTKEIDLSVALRPISGFYIDFSQSFRNLVENALEAMQETPEPHLTVTTALDEGRRVIRITDNGPGIPKAVKPQLFQPFVTTKSTPETPRAGLGLYMARRLLSPYRGEITLSREGATTCATMILP